ncbi:tungsten ABC transporter substrate-binding protein [Candidatus Methylomirabilis lanthanidiphila]|uniref:Tungsten ABC transporter substrate-binding protein n=1 Tax=Candidatus Methylomirabilis lanthanidiphila TaxID=2211376 RepID=A0A564ZN78_9BACT|nr:substrate-binding domain-containing protein [Candidatus Methylomirabilis lanthanidiphila]VUZ86317.1 tungsten ABC transporter substrate-binding protein [Candidatus Methylomirabilis lanthanidiphila]
MVGERWRKTVLRYCVVGLAAMVVMQATLIDVVQGASKTVILATTTSTQDSGLLDVLVPLFEKRTGYLVKTISVGTGQALALGGRGEADVVLVHAPEAEKRYVADGTLINRQLVMHNDFIVVGPKEDPAQIRGMKKASDALRRIAEMKAAFVSRGDNSGTHQLEKRLWKEAGREPIGEWYLESGQGMGQTLGIATEKRAYTLTDRATYLALKKRLILDILVERDPSLLNIYSVMGVNPTRFPKVNTTGGMAFADFIVSPAAQEVIKNFGVEKFGEPLFFPDAGKREEEIGR